VYSVLDGKDATMPANPPPKRRDFLKTAAAGAAGAVGLSALRFDKLFAQSTGGWVSGMQVNPAIDNMRVVCCHDTNMLTSTPANSTWASQNTAVNASLVASNMDEMAMQLAQKATAADAWKAIFRSSKPWASTTVAIKVNAILGASGNHPRVAIVKKICDVLVDQLGVLPTNIVLYDATDDASGTYTSYASLTDSTKIRANVSKLAQSPLLGGMTPVTITSASHPTSCVTNLAVTSANTIDILVDIAVVKVHSGPGTSYSFGSCSLCMKNHLGTFNNTSGTDGATGLHSLAAICEINQHAAILGGNPVRQQLCIVDSLLVNGNSAGGSWDTRVDRIVMGTFAPIVDYLTAMRIMADVMGKPDRNNNLPKFLTNFGYAETDALQWIEYLPSSPPAIGGSTGSTGGSTGTGGTSPTGGTTAAGGTTGTGGTSRNGGASATGGTSGTGGTSRTGGTTATGGSTGTGGTSRTGGTAATGGATSTGGTSDTGGASGTGGTTASGSTMGAGGSTTASTATSSAAGGTSGTSTSATSASGGSTTTAAASAGTGTAATALGGNTGSAGTAQTTGSTHITGTSGSGCNVAGVDRRATRWGALLAVGAVVAGKLRRLVSGGDRL
jgi:TAT (twin-arginine translocation) pathway signal sequence